MFVVNGTLIIFVVSFLVFIKLLDLIMLKPVGKAIAMRQERIQNDLDSGRQARQNAAALTESYELHLSQKRSEAQNLITGAVAAANKQKSEKLEALHKQALSQLESAKAALAAEHSHLLDDLVAHEKELVQEITTKVLGEPVLVQLEPERVRRQLEES